MLEQKIEIVFANEFTSHLILSSSLVLPLHYQNSFCGCIFCNTSNQYFQGSFRRPFDRITEYLLEKKISNHLLLLILDLFGNAKMMLQSSLTKVCKLSLSSCVTSSTLVLLQKKISRNNAFYCSFWLNFNRIKQFLYIRCSLYATYIESNNKRNLRRFCVIT